MTRKSIVCGVCTDGKPHTPVQDVVGHYCSRCLEPVQVRPAVGRGEVDRLVQKLVVAVDQKAERERKADGAWHRECLKHLNEFYVTWKK